MNREELVRLAVFGGLFAIFAIWEALSPKRKRSMGRTIRWISNLTMVGLNTIAIPVLVPIAALGMATMCAKNGWGLFNRVDVPAWVAFALTIVLLDFVIYLQHVMFHSIPILWRLHRVHHSDVDLDASSGIRFHFLEIFISMGIKVCAITLIGPPVLAILAFEVILNGMAMFNHANLRLPRGVDRVLRLFIVTPDMHRVHHSVDRSETDTNYGFNLPWWDYLCGTYLAQPAKGHQGMTIGIPQFRSENDQKLHRLLIQPFLSDDASEVEAVEQVESEKAFRGSPI